MSGYDPYLYMMSPNGGFSGSGFEQVNPYSNYTSGQLPATTWGGGTPNNALGQPIASYQAPQPVYTPPTPGTTLNQTPGFGPGAPGMGAGAPTVMGPSDWTSLMGQLVGASPQMNQNQLTGLVAGLGLGPNIVMGGQGGQPQTTAGSPGGWSTPNNWQAFLQARANPGPVTTPGVTPPAGPQTQPGAGVFPALAQQWAQSGQVRPGIGINSNFVNAMNQLQARGT